MKKTVMMLMLTGLLWACNSNPSPGNDTPTASDVHEHEEATLTLNNGQKWKADAATNENVVAMRTIVQNFSAEPHTGLSDYRILDGDLQKGLDKMIQDCKMQGPDHDALHLWLEPLLKGVSELKKAGDIASAEKTFHAIDERLGLYTQYFE
ncbi:hypothetical protein [Agriterribacter sp.]|uniref:hypothetical protein n=1 Tax=Agriterribacter sp. TaxID=2821509 RepID=UPI002B6BADF2|nr:hypothetical protein [Agriterribacter sp.]HTN08545.1 hypothetical protein [Agriterribacter sp.]